MTITRDALSREAQATRDLLASMATIIGDDEDFALDVVEGQTSLVEVVNALVAQEGEDAAHVAAINAYADKLVERAERIKWRIDKRRGALLSALQTAGLKNLKCPFGTVSVRATPAKLVTTDEAKIPDEFWKTADPTLDRKAVVGALKAGRTVPGAELSNGGVSISIRHT